MTSNQLMDLVEEALQTAPTESGGIAVVLATAGSPPAMALLSSGDVHVSDGIARVGVYRSSSAVSRLGGAFSLLVPLGADAVRLEVGSATVVEASPRASLAKLEGKIESIRPTSEPPWVLEMGFVPESSNHPDIPRFLDYWKQVKAWLAGEQPDPPQIPG